MTGPLRKRHLQIWIVLGLALPGLFAAALAARRDTAPVNSHFVWERFQ